jgi:hypothetical protein
VLQLLQPPLGLLTKLKKLLPICHTDIAKSLQCQKKVGVPGTGSKESFRLFQHLEIE